MIISTQNINNIILSNLTGLNKYFEMIKMVKNQPYKSCELKPFNSTSKMARNFDSSNFTNWTGGDSSDEDEPNDKL